jgi:hypothetical protein
LVVPTIISIAAIIQALLGSGKAPVFIDN